MIVVIDATLWISATHYGGLPARAIGQAALNADIAVSNRIRDEVIKTLTAKFGYTLQEAEEFDRRFAAGAICVDIRNSVRGVCRDPNDVHVLECAQRAGAGFIISGDKYLLSPGAVFAL